MYCVGSAIKEYISLSCLHLQCITQSHTPSQPSNILRICLGVWLVLYILVIYNAWFIRYYHTNPSGRRVRGLDLRLNVCIINSVVNNGYNNNREIEMKDILNDIEIIKNIVGYRVQGSANCYALLHAKNIVKRQTLRNNKKTLDARNEYDNRRDQSVPEYNREQQGFGNTYNPEESLNGYAFVLASLNLTEPTLQSSLDMFKNSEFRAPSDSDIAELVSEVVDEFNSEEDALEYVMAELKEEHQSTCSEWELLGDEIIKVVENAIDYATPTEIPSDLRLKIDVHARNCVIQQRKRHGLSRSLGVCKLLKQLYI